MALFLLILGEGFYGFEVFVVWMGLLTFPGWLLFFLPVVMFVPPERRIFDAAPFAGLGASLAGFAYILFTSLLVEGFVVSGYLAFACIVGSVAGYSYSLMTRSLRHRTKKTARASHSS